MKKVLRFLFATSMLASALASGCGVCVEDRMAAVYDHEVVTRALNDGHQVVFTDVSGPQLPTPAQRHVLARAAQSVGGVIRGSVRTSESPPAMSFAIDAKATAPANAIIEINQRISKQPIRVSLIRALGNPERRAR